MLKGKNKHKPQDTRNRKDCSHIGSGGTATQYREMAGQNPAKKIRNKAKDKE
jgi:hypothetical protein